MRRELPRRGQTLVLFALLMLSAALMAFMTISLGAKAKERLELQTVADAAAYSNAIATARTYNTAALLNRAAVSHWVAMAGVQSLHAWGTLTSAYLKEWGSLSYEFQTPDTSVHCAGLGRTYRPGDSFDDCPEAWEGAEGRQCAALTWQTRDAAYEFWHARYSLYRPGMGSGESVNGRCLQGNCSAPRSRLNPGYGELDEDVAEQARAIRDAVHNLTALQMDTYEHLGEVLNKQTLTTRLLRQSQGLSGGSRPPDGFEVPGVGVAATDESPATRHPAWVEASNAVTEDRDGTHEAALTHAILGSVGLRFPMALEMQNGALRPPRKVDEFLNQIQGYVNQTYPNTFVFQRSPRVKGCAYFSHSTQPPVEDMVKCDNRDLGMSSAVGVAVGRVTVRYKDACTGAWRSKSRDVVAAIRSTTRDANGSAHPGSVDFGDGAFVGGCHGNHSYHGNYWGPDHHLGKRINGHRIHPGGLGYVFPVNEDDGAKGAEGQPKLPLLLTRNETRKDPWELLVRFRFEQGGDAATLDLGQDDRGRGVRSKPQAALAHGMAYYHRRGYWSEPANLLNPFWHATLVRSNIDALERRANDRTAENLRAAGLGSASEVYRRLEALGGEFEGWQ